MFSRAQHPVCILHTARSRVLEPGCGREAAFLRGPDPGHTGVCQALMRSEGVWSEKRQMRQDFVKPCCLGLLCFAGNEGSRWRVGDRVEPGSGVRVPHLYAW